MVRVVGLEPTRPARGLDFRGRRVCHFHHTRTNQSAHGLQPLGAFYCSHPSNAKIPGFTNLNSLPDFAFL